VDAGNVILQARVPIREDETAGELHDRLADIGAEIVLHTLRLIEQGKVSPKPQDDSRATAAPKIFKEHCKIDWTKSAQQVHNLIRGLSPKPGAFSFHQGTQLKFYRSHIVRGKSSPQAGTVVEAKKHLVISCGDGLLEILELQQEGKNKLSAEEFLRGYRIKVGDQFA